MPSGQRPAYWYDGNRVPLLMRLLAALYAGVTGLRGWLYAKGLLRSRRCGVPVIVVGNISVGGTGKTPLTIALVQRLQAEGFTVGVASRGYGREEPSQPRWVDRESNPAKVGDEPALIAHHTTARLRVDRES